MFRIYSKYRMKAALTQWREKEYENICMLQMQTNEEMATMVSEHSIRRENIKQHQVAVKSGRVAKQSCRDWFAAWQVYASEERDTRLRSQNLKMALDARAGAKALRKWRARTEKTQQMRAFLKRGKFVKRQANLRSCFQAWRTENRNQTNLTNKLHAALENLRNLSCQGAFDLIKRWAAEKHSRNGHNKEKGRNVLIRGLENFNETKLRAYFNKMR